MKKVNDSSILIVKGEIAKQIQKEALSKPTKKALERNEKASKLVAYLRR
ncbi:hypothetical protein MKD34_14050 (plasmid) [Cetobacterium somerae]|nr:hypothetical protein [Cetobacterium somerae]UPO99066.1 hypothetical protein MKD34_14050 [Cetobacterium somerae]